MGEWRMPDGSGRILSHLPSSSSPFFSHPNLMLGSAYFKDRGGARQRKPFPFRLSVNHKVELMESPAHGTSCQDWGRQGCRTVLERFGKAYSQSLGQGIRVSFPGS
jgi:hypothetical protein